MRGSRKRGLRIRIVALGKIYMDARLALALQGDQSRRLRFALPCATALGARC